MTRRRGGIACVGGTPTGSDGEDEQDEPDPAPQSRQAGRGANGGVGGGDEDGATPWNDRGRPSVKMSGSKFKEAYKIGPLLGRGAFGVVYTCTRTSDPEPKPIYACKMISKKLDHGLLARNGRREAAIMQQLAGKHEKIVQLVEWLEDERNVYLIMELCKGGDLHRVLKRHGRYSEHSTRVIVRQLAVALAFCHSQGVVHRDLNTKNVFIVSELDLDEEAGGVGRSTPPVLSGAGEHSGQLHALEGEGAGDVSAEDASAQGTDSGSTSPPRTWGSPALPPGQALELGEVPAATQREDPLQRDPGEDSEQSREEEGEQHVGSDNPTAVGRSAQPPVPGAGGAVPSAEGGPVTSRARGSLGAADSAMDVGHAAHGSAGYVDQTQGHAAVAPDPAPHGVGSSEADTDAERNEADAAAGAGDRAALADEKGPLRALLSPPQGRKHWRLWKPWAADGRTADNADQTERVEPSGKQRSAGLSEQMLYRSRRQNGNVEGGHEGKGEGQAHGSGLGPGALPRSQTGDAAFLGSAGLGQTPNLTPLADAGIPGGGDWERLDRRGRWVLPRTVTEGAARALQSQSQARGSAGASPIQPLLPTARAFTAPYQPAIVSNADAAAVALGTVSAPPTPKQQPGKRTPFEGELDVKLADFGLSAVVPLGKPFCRGLKGARSFRAPEMVKGHRYGFPADLWSLGVVMWVMLTGRAPFVGEHRQDLPGQRQAIIRASLDFSLTAWADISLPCKHFIKKLLEPDPAKRITAQGVLSDPWMLQGDAAGIPRPWPQPLQGPEESQSSPTGLTTGVAASAAWAEPGSAGPATATGRAHNETTHGEPAEAQDVEGAAFENGAVAIQHIVEGTGDAQASSGPAQQVGSDMLADGARNGGSFTRSAPPTPSAGEQGQEDPALDFQQQGTVEGTPGAQQDVEETWPSPQRSFSAPFKQAQPIVGQSPAAQATSEQSRGNGAANHTGPLGGVGNAAATHAPAEGGEGFSPATQAGPGLPLLRPASSTPGRGQRGKEPFGFLRDFRGFLNPKKGMMSKGHTAEPANPFEVEGAAGPARPLRSWKSGPIAVYGGGVHGGVATSAIVSPKRSWFKQSAALSAAPGGAGAASVDDGSAGSPRAQRASLGIAAAGPAAAAGALAFGAGSAAATALASPPRATAADAAAGSGGPKPASVSSAPQALPYATAHSSASPGPALAPVLASGPSIPAAQPAPGGPSAAVPPASPAAAQDGGVGESPQGPGQLQPRTSGGVSPTALDGTLDVSPKQGRSIWHVLDEPSQPAPFVLQRSASGEASGWSAQETGSKTPAFGVPSSSGTPSSDTARTPPHLKSFVQASEVWGLVEDAGNVPAPHAPESSSGGTGPGDSSPATPPGITSIVQDSGVWGLVEVQGEAPLLHAHKSDGSEAGASGSSTPAPPPVWSVIQDSGIWGLVKDPEGPSASRMDAGASSETGEGDPGPPHVAAVIQDHGESAHADEMPPGNAALLQVQRTAPNGTGTSPTRAQALTHAKPSLPDSGGGDLGDGTGAISLTLSAGGRCDEASVPPHPDHELDVIGGGVSGAQQEQQEGALKGPAVLLETAPSRRNSGSTDSLQGRPEPAGPKKVREQGRRGSRALRSGPVSPGVALLRQLSETLSSLRRSASPASPQAMEWRSSGSPDGAASHQAGWEAADSATDSGSRQFVHGRTAPVDSHRKRGLHGEGEEWQGAEVGGARAEAGDAAREQGEHIARGIGGSRNGYSSGEAVPHPTEPPSTGEAVSHPNEQPSSGEAVPHLDEQRSSASSMAGAGGTAGTGATATVQGQELQPGAAGTGSRDEASSGAVPRRRARVTEIEEVHEVPQAGEVQVRPRQEARRSSRVSEIEEVPEEEWGRRVGKIDAGHKDRRGSRVSEIEELHEEVGAGAWATGAASGGLSGKQSQGLQADKRSTADAYRTAKNGSTWGTRQGRAQVPVEAAGRASGARKGGGTRDAARDAKGSSRPLNKSFSMGLSGTGSTASRQPSGQKMAELRKSAAKTSDASSSAARGIGDGAEGAPGKGGLRKVVSTPMPKGGRQTSASGPISAGRSVSPEGTPLAKNSTALGQEGADEGGNLGAGEDGAKFTRTSTLTGKLKKLSSAMYANYMLDN